VSQLVERRPSGQVQGIYPVREVRGRRKLSDVPTEFYSFTRHVPVRAPGCILSGSRR